MAETTTTRTIVDGIEYPRLFLFPRIFSQVVAALQPPRLLIGLFMVIALMAVGRIWDAIAGEPTFAAAAARVLANVTSITIATLSLQPAALSAALYDQFIAMPIDLWTSHPVFVMVYGLIALIVLAVGGGAISRLAAWHIATREQLPAREAFRFAATRWVRLIAAPLLPLLLAGLAALVVLVMGVLMLVPVLDIIGGLIYFIALIFGFIVAFLLLVYIAGFWMLVPAVACEDCDAPDAQQRAYAYVLSRPLHLLGYVLIAIIGLALGFALVSIFAAATLNVTATVFGALSRNPALDAAGGVALLEFARPEAILEAEQADPAPMRWHQAAAAWLINLWQTAIVSLVGAYLVAYFFSASTAGYLLMRRASDGQDIEEINRGRDGEATADFAPTTSGAT